MGQRVVTRPGLAIHDALPEVVERMTGLVDEARAALDAGWTCEHDGSGLTPRQRNTRGELGPTARALMGDLRLRKRIGAVAGGPVEPSWGGSCFTGYQGGDFLDPHRDDAGACVMALLVYLGVRAGERPGPGLYLWVQGRVDEAPEAVLARPGRAVLLLGSRLSHSRPALGRDEGVTALTACFTGVGS